MGRAKKKVALVLGAGSARGLSHIGVLQVFQEHRIHFDFIVGSSMGSLIGAIYASGSDIYMMGKLAETLNYKALWDLGLSKTGLLVGRKAEQFIRLMTKNKNFNELNPPLAVVATDIETGEKVIIRDGPLAEAVRASISVPGVFVPVRYKGRLLVDGAVAERLPITAARELGADTVIAVDVVFAEFKRVKIRNTLDVILRTFDIMERQIFEKITKVQADILLQPRLGHIGSNDFDKAGECIRIGRECTQAALPDIKRILKLK